ncbi:type II secretion pathway protein GspD [Prochlorococcus marinus]|uniref:Possible general (Type II) secretion pathway protein D n=1 Tax=Prochlorococcus marinus (strain MIT 9303) TaxID=59922 RepID=A2CDF8_PROM3|nr:type II secretion pathway protein GspD [Prochlorococcus marinus]ABM79518.1 possible general (type II) secretion pathway protein D precursor [Prochlorococcus marinus str. MIT 9303]
MSRSQRLVPLLAALGLYGVSISGGLMLPAPVKAQKQGTMELKLRRSQDSVEVIIEGVGPQPVVQQRQTGQNWEGRLTTQGKPGLRRGPQQVSMPQLGLQSVSLAGSGESYQLNVEGVAGSPLLEPLVSADGRNLILSFPGLTAQATQTGRLDLRTPGRVPQASYVPPLQQRAVAPPLGDMAVGTMVLSNRSFVQVSGPSVTLTLNNAPAKDALMSLARLGGYGFIFVGDDSESGNTTGVGTSADAPGNGGNKKVSMAFQNESYARALNGVLLASGLQGKLDGRTLLVGNAVASKTFGPQVSKVYRLNQASAASAADYLASLGAAISKVNIVSVTSGEASSAGTSQLSNQVSQTSSKTTSIETYGASVGPLRGLTGTTDSRLQTITLVGDSQLVAVAESYLKQIDLRSRQVALSVKILDVNLDNVSDIDNSFSLRFGNNLIINDSGKLLAAFGRNLPADEKNSFGTDFTKAPLASDSVSTTNTSSSSTSAGIDSNSATSGGIESDSSSGTVGGTGAQTRTAYTNFGPLFQLNSQGLSTGSIVIDDQGQPVQAEAPQFDVDGKLLFTPKTYYVETDGAPLDATSSSDSQNQTSTSNNGQNQTSASNNSQNQTSTSTQNRGTYNRRRNPGLGYPNQAFYDFLRAQIESTNTKVLASPTLILSESNETIAGEIGRKNANEAYVRLGDKVVTAFEITTDQNGNVYCEPTFETAGLSLGAKVSKIDDNGFVTFSLEPNLSAKVGEQDQGECGLISTVNERLLETGAVRVRDGQTLILTGVISDRDIQVVTKWPILGDIPVIGQFFRSTNGTKSKSELVIMVTPRIIDDEQGGTYGYGYRPSTRAARNLIYTQQRR